MVYVFLDESGDLGFKITSSKWFLFTMAVSQDQKCLDRVVRKYRQHLRKKYKRIGELHANRADYIMRRQLLKLLAEVKDLKVLCVILNKHKVYSDLQNQKNYLYNYAANILMDRLHNKNLLTDKEPIELLVDRKDTNKNLRRNFIDYLTQGMKVRREGGFKIELKASHESKAIQAVDFISWAIFRKYEKGDFEFYEIIKSKIIEETLLFP